MRDIGIDGLTIGERIDVIAKENGYKVDDLAFSLGLSPNHVRKLLNGDHEWKEEHLKTLSDLFHLDHEYIKRGDYYVRLSDNPMALKERIEHDMKMLDDLRHEDKMEYLSLIFEKASRMILK